mmetsp:Transcript_10257/g.25132  ORF Transcript_10257/g.25132 Transcript_10257/m.25132 type:complete len:307 (+) Transcript_10257:502-1422(+)
MHTRRVHVIRDFGVCGRVVRTRRGQHQHSRAHDAGGAGNGHLGVRDGGRAAAGAVCVSALHRRPADGAREGGPAQPVGHGARRGSGDRLEPGRVTGPGFGAANAGAGRARGNLCVCKSWTAGAPGRCGGARQRASLHPAHHGGGAARVETDRRRGARGGNEQRRRAGGPQHPHGGREHARPHRAPHRGGPEPPPARVAPTGHLRRAVLQGDPSRHCADYGNRSAAAWLAAAREWRGDVPRLRLPIRGGALRAADESAGVRGGGGGVCPAGRAGAGRGHLRRAGRGGHRGSRQDGHDHDGADAMHVD